MNDTNPRRNGNDRVGGANPLFAFLTTDPRDVGCEQAWALVHVYAELVLEGHDPESRYPGVTAHLAACPPCEQDYQGLLIALRNSLA